ncbi:MAG: hypothetical protein EAZ95_20685, partial [Bacteroidetes bacterium]
LNITGSSNTPGVAYFNFTFAGQSCTLNIYSCGAFVSAGVFREFSCFNLGATNTTLDPNVPVEAIHGDYYQWGRNAPAATTSALIGTWGSQGGNSNNGNWTSTGTGGPNDPCPDGFRVPSSAEWDAVIANNTATRTGTFIESNTNFGSSIQYGPNASIKTLTLPATGRRLSGAGTLDDRGTTGNYWSTTEVVSNSTSRALFFSSNGNDTSVYVRISGFSVRCIKE